MQEVQTIEMEQTETEKNGENNAENGDADHDNTTTTDKTAAQACETPHLRDALVLSDAQKKKRGGPGRPFEPGNTAAKGNGELISAAAKRRHILRTTMLEAVTPAKAQQCVKRMLQIINAKGPGSDKKAAVGAFKVLFDLLGAKAVEADAQGPRGFVFILPAAGTIPDVRRIVDNEAEPPCPPVDQPHSL